MPNQVSQENIDLCKNQCTQSINVINTNMNDFTLGYFSTLGTATNTNLIMYGIVLAVLGFLLNWGFNYIFFKK
mgnify:FL=1